MISERGNLSREQAVSDLEKLVPKLLDQSALTLNDCRTLRRIIFVLGDDSEKTTFEVSTGYSTIRHYEAIVSVAEDLLKRYKR